MFAYKLLLFTWLLFCISIMYQKWPTKSKVVKKLDAYYDYVIVGGGTAGAVLAARLSEDLFVKVALLEAGDEETLYPMIDIPLAMFDLQRTSADWAYKTVPQNFSCSGLRNEQSAWPRGKVLGGCSAINSLVYVRGNRADYDRWASGGCRGWSYEEVMPYFLKAENNRNAKFAKSKYHGSRGPMTVQDHMATPKLTNAFQHAGLELGYSITDVNGERQIGVSHTQGNIDYGRRMHTAKAYLRPAMDRPNLHVATRSHVTKVLFKGDQAIGVEYIRNLTQFEVRARKEVILSAGVVASPQLLLLSGVGPRDHLESLGIPVVADLPVGENLQDHVYTDSTLYGYRKPVSITAKKAKGLLPLLDFFVFGHGLLTSGGVEGVAFSRKLHQPEEDPRPHLQLSLLPLLLGNDQERNLVNAQKLNLKEEVYDAIHGHMRNKEGSMLLPVLLHAESRGTIRLKSSDPFDPPDINPRYLDNMEDVHTLVEGIRLTQGFMDSDAFRELGGYRVETRHPACTEYRYDTDLYWQCYVRQNTLTMHHQVGTCKMGAVSDNSSVLDPYLRVRGVGRLRVVDASVMPEIPSGGTAAPTIMIAEKAADMIRGTITVPAWGEELEESAYLLHRQRSHAEL